MSIRYSFPCTHNRIHLRLQLLIVPLQKLQFILLSTDQSVFFLLLATRYEVKFELKKFKYYQNMKEQLLETQF